jgi:hypothetical protein
MPAVPEDFQLSDLQRGRLFDFLEVTDQLFRDGTFERDEQLCDEAILALALRAAELLGMEQEEIWEFFEREFDITGMTGDPIGTALAFAMLIDAERRLQARAGGRN